MTDGAQELPPEVEKAHIEKGALLVLTQSQGWEILVRALTTQCEKRTQSVMISPTGAQQTPYEQEYMKGEWNGMKIALGMPELLIDACNVEIDSYDSASSTSADSTVSAADVDADPGKFDPRDPGSNIFDTR